MDDGKSWLRAHWRTAVALVLIFGLALFLRVYFVYGLAFNTPVSDCTKIYTPPYSGGSDSYYWDRALCYSYLSGRELGTDPMLAYPFGVQNPRPPLFPWFSLLVGRLLAPLFASPWNAVQFTFLLSTGFFGALSIFPTYALAKEAFGRKAGLVSGLLLAISVGHLQRSASTDADHDAFTLFFVVSSFYFFLRALKVMGRRRWVENWFRKDTILSGFRSFFRENRSSVLYAFLAGLCVSVVALAWQGWAYVAVILLVWFGLELFLDRFRNEDTMGTWLLITIALGTALALAFQWYYVRHQISVWYDVPAYLFFAAFVFGLAFTVTRDYPWTLVIPSTLIATAVGLAVGVVVNPTVASAFFTGAGYFVQTKVVTTIAEDQSPGMSQIILSFGLFTFGISLVSIAYLLWQVPRRRDPAYAIVVVWAFAAIFMAISAARFIFNASPAFAISAGFAIDQVLVRADFAGMRRTYRSLAEGSWRNAVRKSVKLRHVLAALGIVGLVLLPNVWWAVDASIPFELKSQYDRQVANLLPAFLRAPGYSATSGNAFYFGAFGYNLPKATDYYPAAWQWFATQDANTPPELRPAFLSWWDYGFEAVDRGVHPTVADNFQHGVQFAGQFITAQNETQSIALLAVRLAEGDFLRNRGDFTPAVRASLQGSGLSVDTFRDAFLHPQNYVSVVLSDTATYGSWAPDLTATNAEYIFLTSLVSRQLAKETVVSLYHSMRDATGWSIGYFAVDSRLFPSSVQNTGIFYAPVKLSDHRVIQLPDGRVLPFDFFQILANTSRGSNLPIQFVGPGDQIQSEVIQYQPAFYNSMFYRAYIGYTPRDLGSNDTGVPGISQGPLQGVRPAPAWGLAHWRVVYRTAYYNPFTDVGNHTSAWQAMNYDQAQRLQSAITAGKMKGVVDLSPQSSVANGVIFLRYYDGAWVNGTVSAGSVPLPRVLITVTDELGTPHYAASTDANGHYSVLVPFGNVTITASVGSVSRTTLIGSRVLASVVVPVTEDQAMRSPADLDGDTIPDWIMTRNLNVPSRAVQGTLYYDLNRNAAFGPGDTRAPGAAITLTSKDFAYNRSATSRGDGTYSIDGLLDGLYTVNIVTNGRRLFANDLTVGSSGATSDIAVPFAEVHGLTSGPEGPVASANVVFQDETNHTTIRLASQGNGSYQVGPLLPGNYTVTASAGDLAALPARIKTSGSDLWLNLTLVPVGTVAGTTTVFGTARPFASLDFQSATNPQVVRTTASDATAAYSIRLPAGEWFVNGRFYDSSGLYATLARVFVTAGSTTTFSAMFVQGVRLNGTVNDANPSVSNPQATLAFSSAAGQLWLRTDAVGGYLAFLPTGSYDVMAFNQAGAYYASASLSASTRMTIALLATSESVNWIVFRDLNGNGAVNPGEAIPGARVSLTDDQRANVVFTTNATGEFRIPLFGNRTYSGSVSAFGYATHSILPASPAELRTILPVALVPIPISVQGSVLLNGSAVLNHPISIRAVPLGNGAVASSTLTDSGGGYSLALFPGTYNLVVDENVSTTRDWRYQNLATDRIVLAVGQPPLAHDLWIIARTRVVGNVTLSGSSVAASLNFQGPDQRTVNATTNGFEVYLIPGTYAVIANRTVAPDQFAFMTTATLPAATNLSFPLINATRVLGHVLFNGAAVAGPMPITFVRVEGGSVSVSTDALGAYTAFLVPGNYTVQLSGTRATTEGGSPRFYRFDFTGTASVSPGQSVLAYDLATSRVLDNTTMSGTVTLSGVGVDATITFTGRAGGAITSRALADSSGAFSTSLAPGTYDVYATRAFGSAAFLGRVTVVHTSSVTQNLPLAQAFLLSGVTTNPQGARTSASITIQSEAEIDLTSDASGGYQIVLPSGAYAIAATKSGTENGIAVAYRATASVSLTSDTIVNLPLAKVVSRSASLTWDATQRREISAGGSVAYTVVVRNSGNVADTFALVGRPADWQFSFAPSFVALDFGTASNSTAVRVTIQSPANALVNHGPIQIVATSAADGSTVGSVDVQVDIQRTRGLSISLDPASTFDSRYLNYTVLLKNAGNAPENVTVSITNPNDLAAIGWSANLGMSGGPATGPTLPGVTVGANATVKLRIQARSTSGPTGATVALSASATDSMAVFANDVFVLQLPQIAPGLVVVTGPEILPAAPLNLPILAVVVGAVAAIGAGLVLSRRRR